ncbi:MAG: hypothetical protein JWR49_725, partial [Tardiphaga sp.]|nr:hypothetical protein [Tardiphaga sp.]
RGAAVGDVDGDCLAVRRRWILCLRLNRGNPVETEISDGQQQRVRIKQRHPAAAEIADERDAVAPALAADWQTRSRLVKGLPFEAAAPRRIAPRSDSSTDTRSTQHSWVAFR